VGHLDPLGQRNCESFGDGRAAPTHREDHRGKSSRVNRPENRPGTSFLALFTMSAHSKAGRHLLTVLVEDYFHVGAFENLINSGTGLTLSLATGKTIKNSRSARSLQNEGHILRPWLGSQSRTRNSFAKIARAPGMRWRAAGTIIAVLGTSPTRNFARISAVRARHRGCDGAESSWLSGG